MMLKRLMFLLIAGLLMIAVADSCVAGETDLGHVTTMNGGDIDIMLVDSRGARLIEIDYIEMPRGGTGFRLTPDNWKRFVALYSEALRKGNSLAVGSQASIGAVDRMSFSVKRTSASTAMVMISFEQKYIAYLDGRSCVKFNELIGKVNANL